MRNAIVIFNPRAGRQRGAASGAQLVAALAGQGMSASLAETQYAGHATELARQAVGADAEVLVVTVGGDGTIREAVAGLDGGDATLLPLAGGTANVIARGLGTAGAHLSVLAQWPQLQRRRLDVADCAGSPFLMQASAGVDAFVMREVNPFLKRHLGVVGVGISGFACALRYGFPAINVTVDGVAHQCTGVIAASYPYYAGLYHLGPTVLPDDGRLNAILIKGKGFAAAAGFSRDLALGRHLRRRDVETCIASSITIEGPADIPVQVDGDVFTAAKPLHIGMISRQVNVMCSPIAPAFRGP